MPFVHVKAELQRVGGASEDLVVNTFSFGHATMPVGELADNAIECVGRFYNIGVGGHLAVGQWISNLISRTENVHLLKAYDISVAHIPIERERPDGSTYFGPGPMGSPIRETATSLIAPAAGDALPAEVSACLSYTAPLIAGEGEEAPPAELGGPGIRPRARKRGRLFIGPLVDVALVAVPQDMQLSQTIRESLLSALDNELINNAEGIDFVLWSRVTGFMHVVSGGWVDNAPDTVRRRGARSTGRSTFNL